MIHGRAKTDDAKGFTHAFMVVFDSEQHREYYVTDDPAHQEFKASARSYISRVQVFDFVPGVF
jgi:hypothetical protein